MAVQSTSVVRDRLCTKWTVALANFLGVSSKQCRPFRRRHLLPTMWLIFIEFRSASSEIRRRKKKKSVVKCQSADMYVGRPRLISASFVTTMHAISMTITSPVQTIAFTCRYTSLVQALMTSQIAVAYAIEACLFVSQALSRATAAAGCRNFTDECYQMALREVF